MLSASHNAMPDNGIKFFARGGHKLPDEVEDRIEAAMGERWARPIGADVGRVVTMAQAHTRYIAHLLRVLPNQLDGLKVVIDAPTAPRAWSRRRSSGSRAPRWSRSAPLPTV